MQEPVSVWRHIVSASVCLGLLGGCAQGPLSTQTSRIGADDGTDSCRRYLVALDAQGDYFGADILKGAAIGAAVGGLTGLLAGKNLRSTLIGAGAGAIVGGAAGYWSALQQQSQDRAVLVSQVTSDLQRENGEIGRAQFAFDALVDCRFREAQTIQANYAAHRIDRPAAVAQMAQVKQRAAHDLEVAHRLNDQIAGRGQQFEVAAENVQPGAGAALSSPPPQRQAVVRRAAPLKLQPNPNSPDVGKVAAREAVQVGASRGGYAVVQTTAGTRGYAAVDIFQGGPAVAPVQVALASTDVRTLAGSNAARRDDFAQSVAVSEQASRSGFELVG
jgi:hypothetical protein